MARLQWALCEQFLSNPFPNRLYITYNETHITANPFCGMAAMVIGRPDYPG